MKTVDNRKTAKTSENHFNKQKNPEKQKQEKTCFETIITLKKQKTNTKPRRPENKTRKTKIRIKAYKKTIKTIKRLGNHFKKKQDETRRNNKNN